MIWITCMLGHFGPLFGGSQALTLSVGHRGRPELEQILVCVRKPSQIYRSSRLSSRHSCSGNNLQWSVDVVVSNDSTDLSGFYDFIAGSYFFTAGFANAWSSNNLLAGVDTT